MAKKVGGKTDAYLEAKTMAKSAVYHAKKLPEKEKMQNLEKKEGKNYIFILAKKIKHEKIRMLPQRKAQGFEGPI